MTIETLYRAQCKPCERYLPREEFSRVADISSRYAALFINFSSAYDEAVRRGWSAYPLRCPDCAQDLKEAVVNNKTAGLYVNLLKALNALSEAGESLEVVDGVLEGLDGTVYYDSNTDRWSLVQA